MARTLRGRERRPTDPTGANGDTELVTPAVAFDDDIDTLPEAATECAVPLEDRDDTAATVGPDQVLPQPAAIDTADRKLVRVLQGHIDQANWKTIRGWVWDPRSPAERIRLDVVEGDSRLLTVVADGNRPDLIRSGIGDGRHAFSVALDDRLSNGRHVLHLRCADSGTELTGSPVTLEPGPATAEPDSLRSASAAESRLKLPPEIETDSVLWDDAGSTAPRPFRSSIDDVTDTEIAGWILDPTQVSRRCTVALKEGDRLVSRAVASIFRQDLQSAGVGDGCHAFALPMPRSLLDGNDHVLEVVETASGLPLTDEPIRWRSGAGTGGAALKAAAAVEDLPAAIDLDPALPPAQTRQARLNGAAPVAASRFPSPTRPVASGVSAGTRILFDVSDLIYYIGHHPNLTGIQRVQSSIVLAVVMNELVPSSDLVFVSFNARSHKWVAIPTGFLASLLEDMFQPQQQRLVRFPADEARYGMLPGARELDGAGLLDSGTPSVLCLLGAAWVQRDYFHRVLNFKRRYGTRFVMTIHDLIPIYARETCDQGTARVFEEFLRRALRHVDHFLSVSDNTAQDLKRYARGLSLLDPPITVTRNGSSFDEFLPAGGYADDLGPENLPDRFALFVATIEGRKNHRLVFDIWRRMVEDGDDPPYLVCVGRVGWKSESFIADLVETSYLGGKVILLQDVSDAHLKLMYTRSLFTLCPSLYEGWGLPVGESLAAGKICVCSDRASIPEVAGEFGVYLDLDSVPRALEVVRGLIADAAGRKRLEDKIRRGYRPITWRSVAENVVAACQAVAKSEWREPYPYPLVPYSTEISFAWLGREPEGAFGDDLLAQIVDTRRGHFLNEPLQEQSFLRGEDVRAAGSWGEPENWGTWLCQSGGELALGLAPRDCSLYYVFLRLRAPGPLSELPIRIGVSGETLWSGILGPRPRDVYFTVRRRAVNTAGWRLRLRVDVDLSPDLRNEIAAVDGRVPVLGFERLVVVPQDDLKSRLDILYTLLL